MIQIFKLGFEITIKLLWNKGEGTEVPIKVSLGENKQESDLAK